MQQNKKQTKKRKSKKTRKPKVYIPAYKIIILCGLIIVVCMSLLLVTTIRSNERPVSSISERYAKTEIVEEKQEEKKSSGAQTRSQNDTQNKTQNDITVPPKTQSQKKSATQKQPKSKAEPKTQTPPQTQAEQKTPAQQSKQAQPKAEPQAQPKSPSQEQPKSQAETHPQAQSQSQSKSQSKSQVQASTPPQDQHKTPATSNQTSSSIENTKKIAKKDEFNFPVAKNNAQLIFVFDDGGHNLSQLEPFLNLPIPITIAVLPRLTHSVESAQKIRNAGKEVILHQPMQAVNAKINPGPGAITLTMTEDEIISTLFYNINEIGPIEGINNHEGSAITADAQKMSVILKITSEEGLCFLDSRTNAETKVPYVSKQMGYSYYERNIFLDNEKTKENALQELKKGLDIANKNGSVIMIGHIWSANFLPSFIMEVLPELQEKGYTFTTVSKSNARKY